MKRRDWAVAIALALCAATLAACGSSAGDGGSDDDPAEQEEARLEFAECMREHGIDMPDPKPGEDGILLEARKTPGGKTTGVNPDDPKTKAALAACEDKVGNLGEEMSPEQEEKFKEQALTFAQCMREHGIDMPDPEFEAGGKVKMRVGGQGGGPSPESPAFRKAQEACGSNGPGGDGFMFGAPPK